MKTTFKTIAATVTVGIIPFVSSLHAQDAIPTKNKDAVNRVLPASPPQTSTTTARTAAQAIQVTKAAVKSEQLSTAKKYPAIGKEPPSPVVSKSTTTTSSSVSTSTSTAKSSTTPKP